MSDERSQAMPRHILAATFLLWGSLAIGVLSSFLDFNPSLHRVPPLFIFAVAAFTFGIMILLIHKIGRGRNWARIALLLLFVAGLFSFVPNVAATFNRSTIMGVLGITQMVLQFAALYCVFSKPGDPWFRKVTTQ